MQHFDIFLMFSVHGENGLGWTHMGPGRIFVPTNPDLADILGRTDLNFENFTFFVFWISDFWIFRFPDFQNLAWAGLGPWAGWALGGRVGPRAGPRVGLGPGLAHQ